MSLALFEEFERLSTLVLEETATPEELARFNAILRAYPELASVYFEQVQTHVMLELKQVELKGLVLRPKKWKRARWVVAAAVVLVLGGVFFSRRSSFVYDEHQEDFLLSVFGHRKTESTSALGMQSSIPPLVSEAPPDRQGHFHLMDEADYRMTHATAPAENPYSNQMETVLITHKNPYAEVRPSADGVADIHQTGVKKVVALKRRDKMTAKQNLQMLATAALLTGAALPTVGAEYHVDGTSGSDSNDGLSPETAFSTLGQGLFAAKTGSGPEGAVLHLWPGTAYTTGGDLLLTNKLVMVGESETPVSVTGAYVKITPDSTGMGDLFLSNLVFVIGSPTSRKDLRVVENNSTTTSSGRFTQTGGTLAVYGNSLGVGWCGGTGSPNKWAVMSVQNTAEPVLLDLLSLYIGVGANSGTSYGSLDLSGSAHGTLKGSQYFQLAFGGSHTEGNLKLGSDWTFQLGGASSFASSFYVGYNSSVSATGMIAMAGGTFEIYANNAYVGCGGSSSRNWGALDFRSVTNRAILKTGNLYIGSLGSVAYGRIDLGFCTNVSFSANVLRMGYGGTSDMYGRLVLGSGAGTAGSVTLGKNRAVSETNIGLLELRGMELFVTNSLVIDKSGTVSNFVNGTSAGLHFTFANAASLQFNNTPDVALGTGINLVFEALPERQKVATKSTAESIYWALKWNGNHVDDLNTLRQNGKLVWNTDALPPSSALAITVFYDDATDATYVGAYTRRAAEPTVVIII